MFLCAFPGSDSEDRRSTGRRAQCDLTVTPPRSAGRYSGLVPSPRLGDTAFRALTTLGNDRRCCNGNQTSPQSQIGRSNRCCINMKRGYYGDLSFNLLSVGGNNKKSWFAVVHPVFSPDLKILTLLNMLASTCSHCPRVAPHCGRPS